MNVEDSSLKRRVSVGYNETIDKSIESGKVPIVDSELNEFYDPYDHRNDPGQTNNVETLINLIKISIGTGMLALPQAFSKAGWLNGIISTTLIGFLCLYCLHLLIKAQYYLCVRHKCSKLTFTETMRLAFLIGPHSLRKYSSTVTYVVDTLIIVNQFGTGCIYIMFMAKNLKKVGDIYTTEELTLQTYFLIILLPILLINCLRSMKILVPFSMIANVLTFIGVCCIFYYIFQDFPGLEGKHSFGGPREYIFYFGTTIFSFGIAPIVPAIENSMKTPKNFGGYCGILNIGTILVISLYVSIGFFGYAKYGDKVADTITLELPLETDIIARVTLIMFILAIFLSTSIQYYVPCTIIWNSRFVQRYVEKSDNKLLLEYVLRMVLVGFTYVLAFILPKLGLFISLFGCFCLSALALLFPALCDICINWTDSKSALMIFKNSFIIVFSFVALVSGTYTSIQDIITT